MPIARFELPDGRIGRFEVPDGTTPEQAIQLISSNLGSLIPKEEPAPAQQVGAPVAAPAPVAVAAPTAAQAPGKPWWSQFAESAIGEAELGKQVGPKVLGGNLAQDIFAAGQATPTYAKAATQALVGGNNPEDLTSQTDWRHDTIAEARELSKKNAKDPSLQDEYILGITRQKVRELPQNAMFSVISMGAGLAAGAAGMVAGPISAYGAGTAASGLAAYRMDTNGFLRDIRENLDEASVKATGKPLTDKQWLDYAKQYNGLVKEHGLWEAVPEALGNALGAKLGATIFREAGKGLMGTLKSFGATALEFGTELGTETVTQTGQHNVEVDAGLSDQPKRSFANPSDIAKSAKEVLPDVLLLSGMVAGGAHVAGKVYNNTEFGQNKQIADAIKENVKAGNFSPDKIRKEAIARLDPNSYNQESIQPEKTVDRNKRLPVAVAPPEQPPEEGQQVAGPSISQDTQAMLDELSGAKKEEVKPNDVAFDATGWEKVERKNLQPGTEVLKKTDDANNTHSVVLRNGTVSQSSTTSPNLAIKNSYLAEDEGDVLNGKIIADNVTGKLSFVPVSGKIIELTPRASEAYKAGIPFEKIAEQEFSDAGGIKPDGTLTPHTTTVEVLKPTETKKEEPAAPKAEEKKTFKLPQKISPTHLSPEFQAVYEHHLKSAEAAYKAKSMLKTGVITQEQAQPFIDQSEKARTDMYEALLNEKDNLSPENKETIDLAKRAINANQRGFAEGMLSNVIKSSSATPKEMDFRRSRTAELEAMVKPEESVPIKETINLNTLLESHELDKKRLDNFGKFDDRTKESITKTNEYLQKLTDAINAKGFSVFEVNHVTMSQDVKDLKTAFSNLYAGATRMLLDTQHVAGKQARKSKKSHGEQNVEIQAAQKKLNKSHIEQNKDIEKARDLLGEIKRKEPKPMFKREELQGTPAPLPEEVSNAEEIIKLNKQDINKAKRASYSLWTALKGALTAGNVADLGDGYRMLKAGKGKQGVDISSLVHAGTLDPFLPFNMRTDSSTYDELNSVEEIKNRLLANNYLTYEAEMEIDQLMGSIKDAESQIREYLTLKEINELIDQAADEQREADLNARILEPEREEGAPGASENELALTGQTPEEVRAAERAKEDRLKTEREAEAKAKADEGVGEFTLTGSNRPADIAAAKGQEDLFGEAPEQRALSIIKQDMVRFASGMSGISDLETGTRARGSHQNHGIGVDVGLLSNNAIDSLAHAILNMNVPVFIDSGAFSNFRQNLKGNGPKPLDFNKILAKYDQITEAIHNLNEDERTDYPRPIIVMPDIVGDQAGSLALIDKHKDWIIPEIKGNITQPMIPIQNGALTLSQAYDHVVKTLGTDDFIVGVPSNAEAITKDQLADFLRESKPKNIHFLGAASDSKLNPLLNIVANESPDTKVTADASKVRSAILDGVTKGKTREQAIMDALMEEEDPGVLLAKFGPQITDESDIIDGTDLVREVGNEEQLLLIADESNKLTANEKAALEEEYGAKHGSNEFLERLHNDVFNFITQGAKSIKNRIRPIINKIANSLLSVAMVLNPSFITKPEIIAVPQYETRTETIYADVPADAKAKMSPAAQQIYSVVYPTIKTELMENNKFFILTDKPTARNFIFNPDGSLLLDKKVLLSKSMGDFLPSGSNNIDANKITPAGLYNLGLRDASRSKGEAETAGEYDYGKVFVIEHAGEGRHGPYSMTIMHSVWTHESDAAQRLAALKTERPDVSRFSFGCINVDKETFGDLVKNHLSQMDGAKLFIVPDSATNAMDFVNGKATYRDDMMRQRVEPLTREVKTPIKEAKKPREEQIAAKEEEYQIPLNAAVRNFNMPIFPGAQTTMEIDRKNAVQEYAKVNQRRAYVLKEVAKQGSSLSLQQELTNLNALAKNLKDYIEDTKDQARTAGDFDTYARQLLNNYEKAKRNGLPEEGIAKEVYDVIHAAYEKAPFLLEGLKLSVIQSKDIFNSTLGEFDLAEQIVKLYKKTTGVIKAEIVRHELAHAMEQMMSPAAKVALIEAWERDFKATVKKSQNPQAKNYIHAVEMFFANPSNATYDAAVAAIPTVTKTGNKEKDREEFNNWYQFLTPSEYWAVNAEKLMHKKLGSGWDRFVLAMRRLFEGLKKVLGVNHKSEVYKVFNDIFSRKPSERIGQSIANVAAGIGVSLKSQGQMFPPAPQPQQVAPLSPQGRQGNMFPPGPPSKRNVFGGPAPQKTWDLAPETKLGHLINTLDYKIYDKHVDTRQVQAAITKNSGLIDDAFDAYMKEELYHGRTANEIKDFLKNDLSPVVKDLISAKLSIDDLEQYLHNRHAEERNDAIAQINPRFADVDNEPGSGIGTQAAKDYFKNLDPTKAAELAKIAAKVDDIIKGTQKILVDRGLETQATIDNWNQAYKHYIPLMRDQEELDFMHHGVGLGKGFQVKGSASKRAYGSTKSVVDILANIAIQRESAIIRSEKARIGRALYGMALKNPNPDFWLPVNPDAIKNKAALYQELVSMGLPISTAQNFIQEPKTPSIDPLTGQVRYTINAGLRGSQNVFPVRINGKDRYIFFNTKDPKAIRMAQAMSNLDAQTLGGLLGTSAQITRWIASVNTQFNPVFGVINFTRDSFGAAFNLTNTPLAGKQKEVAKHVFPAMFAIFQGERASRKNAAITGPYVALYDQFRRAGGTTGFRESFAKGNFSGKDTTIVERLWADETQSGAMKKARYVFDALSDYNEAMENAVRLSVFKVALDMGLSEERAASLGKNVTINFNRKGQASPLLQALYAFFNPAAQGAVLVGKTLNGPAGRKIIAGGLAVGVLQALWMAAAGFDADEPPDYIRDKNFIIPIGNKKYLTLPMPPGYNVVPGVARIATEYILGKNHLISGGKPITDAATQVLSLFLDSFNPLGGGTIAQMLSPTPIDPIVAVTMNKDAFGRPIFKEDTALKPTPGFMRSRENSTQISQWIAEFLNYVSSPPGTHYTKGKISPTADEIDYYAGQIGGGAAREVIKAGELAKSAFTSEPVPSYRIPLAGRFYGDAKSQAAIQDKFYNNITLMNKYGNEIINTQKSGQDPSKYMAAHPEAQLYYAASNFNNVINEMNTNKKNMLKNKVPLKDIREYEAQKYQIMKTFNDQVSNAQKQK